MVLRPLFKIGQEIRVLWIAQRGRSFLEISIFEFLFSNEQTQVFIILLPLIPSSLYVVVTPRNIRMKWLLKNRESLLETEASLRLSFIRCSVWLTSIFSPRAIGTDLEIPLCRGVSPIPFER